MQRLSCLVLGVFLLLAGCTGERSSVPSGASPGSNQEGVASYYGARHHGLRTASGERFDQNSLTAAHRTLPFGTQVRVTNLENAKSVVVRINDRGPRARARLIDLSRGAAEQLGMTEDGTAHVRIEPLD